MMKNTWRMMLVGMVFLFSGCWYAAATPLMWGLTAGGTTALANEVYGAINPVYKEQQETYRQGNNGARRVEVEVHHVYYKEGERPPSAKKAHSRGDPDQPKKTVCYARDPACPGSTDECMVEIDCPAATSGVTSISVQ